MDFSSTYGKGIRRLRKARGWTQTDLAKNIGSTYRYIGQIERGERLGSVEFLESLCNALNCTPNDLLLSAESPPTPK